MGDRVAHKSHSPQYYERADNAACGGRQCRHEQRALHEPILHRLEDQVEHSDLRWASCAGRFSLSLG